MITVTLDTNVLAAHWDEEENSSVTESLLNLARQGNIDLAITSRINADVTRSPWKDRINELQDLNVRQISGPLRWDYSKWDEGDVFGSDDFAKVMTSLEEGLDREGRKKKRPDWRDWDHLHGHYLARRQFFLTWDEGIVYLSSKLREKLDIVVMKPEEFLA